MSSRTAVPNVASGGPSVHQGGINQPLYTAQYSPQPTSDQNDNANPANISFVPFRGDGNVLGGR